MKKIIALVLLLCLIIVPVSAQEESIHFLDSMILQQTSSNYVDILPKDSNYRVDYFEVWLQLFAQDDHHQTVLSQNIVPSFSLSDDRMIFRFDDLKERQVSFSVDQTIKVSSNPVQISSQVSFPVKDVPLDFVEYTQFTEHIDSSQDILDLASTLAQGEDDLFIIEHKIASWVNEYIKYNLSTITSEANIPSSIVLDQKYGVCDEITNLFISLNRALGIPARFVSGIAYSDSILFAEKWGNHGWAEVYFPGYGWVAYDVTYDQFARLDPSHIALQKSVDGNSASVQYKTSGFNYDFSQGILDMETVIVKEGSKRPSDVSIDLTLFSDSVSFGSYNVVFAKVSNRQPYYLSEEITLIATDNTEVLSPEVQRVVLKPKETKILSWVIQVSPDLDPGYFYTFPMVVIDSLHYRTDTSFKVDQSDSFIAFEDVNSFLFANEDKKSLSFSCVTNRDVLVNEGISLSCDFSSVETFEFPLRVCIRNNCQTVVSGKENVSFDFVASSLGVKTFEITAKGNKHSSSSYLTVRTVDLARVAIEDVVIPEFINANTNQALSFKLAKTSMATPENITITISHALFSEVWFNELLVVDQPYSLTIPGNMFHFGENEISISYSFVDASGSLVFGEERFIITMDKVSGPNIIIVGLNSIDKSVNKILNKEQDRTTTIISVVFCAVVLSLILTLFQRTLRLIFKRKS